MYITLSIGGDTFTNGFSLFVITLTTALLGSVTFLALISIRWSVGLSLIIFKMGRKLHFHAPIRALVAKLSTYLHSNGGIDFMPIRTLLDNKKNMCLKS